MIVFVGPDVDETLIRTAITALRALWVPENGEGPRPELLKIETCDLTSGTALHPCPKALLIEARCGSQLRDGSEIALWMASIPEYREGHP
jgi:hypothetical protein